MKIDKQFILVVVINVVILVAAIGLMYNDYSKRLDSLNKGIVNIKNTTDVTAGLVTGVVETQEEINTNMTRITQQTESLEHSVDNYFTQTRASVNHLQNQINLLEEVSKEQLGELETQLEEVQKAADFTAILPEVSEAIVAIGTQHPEYPDMFISIASGTVISSNGQVITNHHVIDELEPIIVKMQSGKEYEAEIIKVNQGYDMALIKIQSGRRFKYIEFAEEEPFVGQRVVAMGNPLGLGFSVTEGIISNTARKLPPHYDIEYIQTDVALNPGNSGGPLINIDGKILGINSMKAGAYEGIGFALKTKYVLEFIE